MTTFAHAVENTPVETRTENGMRALVSSLNKNVDLFFAIGASRGKDVTGLFEKAFLEDQEIALRVLQWARDVRGGAGERQIYRNMLKFLEKYYRNVFFTTKILENTAEIGRWDDLLIFSDKEIKEKAYGLIRNALEEGNGLAAKWMPRKGPIAADLRNFLCWTPKFYRKRLVELTKVVETQMCARDWNSIDFSKVPSLAMARYTRAFGRNAEAAFNEYIRKLESGDKSVKVNAGAVYPYDVLKTMFNGNERLADQQWNALPNYMNDSKVLPMVDVSGSMCTKAGNGKLNMSCLHVAISLGLYCADKNQGSFKDLILTFSSVPELIKVKGSLRAKYDQLSQSDWGMSTNLHAAFDRVLEVAVKNKVSQEEMPDSILILSDMQFNCCTNYDDTAIEMIRRKYETHGYEVPNVVFWNLNDKGNTPVTFNEKGVALVSGFSPAIMESILGADHNKMTPEYLMKEAVNIERYNIFG